MSPFGKRLLRSHPVPALPADRLDAQAAVQRGTAARHRAERTGPMLQRVADGVRRLVAARTDGAA